MALIGNGRRHNNKKTHGIYYTPDELVEAIGRWAIRGPLEDVFEPSFGGCGFLRFARDRLARLGSTHPMARLYGCDVDPVAFQYLQELGGEEQSATRFRKADFLSTQPTDFGLGRFDVLLGNPPYVSHHNMDAGQARSARKAIENAGFSIDRTASLWAYFVIHGLAFLKDGGRMAWVLPGSFLTSDYARPIREHIAHRFGRAVAIRIKERQFRGQGTDEASVILVGLHYGGCPSGELDFIQTEAARTLGDDLFRWERGSLAVRPLVGKPERSLLSDAHRAVVQDIESRPETVRLGSIARVEIGIVTGASKYFLLRPSDGNAYGLPPAALVPVLSAAKYMHGLQLTRTSVADLVDNDQRCLLFCPGDESLGDAAVNRYLRKIPAEVRQRNVTFAKRKKWFRCDDGRRPDAFLSPMAQFGPTMMMNEANINATNSIYRVWFAPPIPAEFAKLACLSTLSSFTQLSAELEGRSLPGGALKLEPSDARRLCLHLPNVNPRAVERAFLTAHDYLSRRKFDAAVAVADHTLFRPDLNTGARRDVAILRDALRRARENRNVTRNGKR